MLVYSELAISPALRARGGLKTAAESKRLAAIAEAISWPSGPSEDHRAFTPVYSFGRHIVGIGKPGKEAFRDRDRNANDMLPTTLDDEGYDIGFTPNFSIVFKQLWQLHAQSPDAVRLLGCLLFRNAYMLDHEPDEVGHLRYRPSERVLQAIESSAPVVSVGSLVIPVRTYLFVLEMLALNEDVKYWTLRDGLDASIGRPNNLLTCVNVIASRIGNVHPFDVGYALMRGKGVAPITFIQTWKDFPELNPVG